MTHGSRRTIHQRPASLSLLPLLLSLDLPAFADAAITAKSPRPLVASAWAHTKDVRRSLAEVLDAALGSDRHKADELHLDELKEHLRPLYDVLPKNGKGLLEHSTVRYALHRHFVHHHGMYVKGFESTGDSWNSSSPTEMMEDRVPSYVQDLFDEWLHDGLSLDDLALFAATLEHFVQTEALERLQEAYRLTNNQEGINGSLSVSEVDDVMDTYLTLFLDGRSHRDMTPMAMLELLQGMRRAPDWEATVRFARKTQEQILETEQGEDGSLGSPRALTFQVVSKVVEAVTEGFGKHQNVGCRQMASALIAKEERGSGRVPLNDFYRAGPWFRESKEFLTQLGALEGGEDASTKGYVIIPNYITARPNCVHSSSLYSVCCFDLCEGILRSLEEKVAAPSATAAQLADAIASIPSESVNAPRALSDTLRRRLGEMAEVHKGDIPLHGRLLAQWLHHAYPRECPYPLRSGTRRPLTADAWLEAQGVNSLVTDEELEDLLSEREAVKVKDLVDGDMEATLPWDVQEELVYDRPPPSILHECGVVLKLTMVVGLLTALATTAFRLAERCTQKAII